MGINEAHLLHFDYTLNDVVLLIDSDAQLNKTQKRDQRSALMRVAKLLNVNPKQVIASPRLLSTRISCVHPAQHNISQKTWQNIKANLLAALRHLPTHQRKENHANFNTEWQCHYNQLPSERLKYGLSRFIRFCSDNEIHPGEVNDDVITIFLTFLENNTLFTEKQIRDSHRRVTRLWNEAIETIVDWPNQVVTVPSFRKPQQTLPLSAFPNSLQKEINDYLLWLTDPDPFSEHRPIRVCKPKTIALRKKQIQLMASATVKEGIEIDALTSLGDLTTPENAKHALRHYLNKKGKDNAFIIGLGSTLIHIADAWLRLDDERIKDLKIIRRQLGQLNGGMTDKNRETLRQFESDQSKRLLLNLPHQLILKSRKQTGLHACITRQLAIAIELLINAPIRMGNLISLEFDKHLIKPGGKKEPYHLILKGHETKNAQPLEFILSISLTEMIDNYRQHDLPIIKRDEINYLFPGERLNHKSPATLAQQLKETIYAETGLTLTPHQFRHLAALLYLDRHPGHYETVRQLLGHKNLKTTTSFYASMNSRQAQKLFDNTITELREHLNDYV